MCAWARIDDKLHKNAKIQAASSDAVRLWLIALSWCNDELSDGYVPAWMAARLTRLRRPDATIKELVRASLWHLSAHPCKSCIEQRTAKKLESVVSGGYVIHDYLEYQPAAWEVRAAREQRSTAGEKGAQKRWGARAGDGASHSGGHNGSHSASYRETVKTDGGSHSETDAPAAMPRNPTDPTYPSSGATSGARAQEDTDDPVIPDDPRATDRKAILGTKTNGLQPPISSLDEVVASARERVAHG